MTEKNTLLTSESQEAHVGVEESHWLRSHAHSMLQNYKIKEVVWFKSSLSKTILPVSFLLESDGLV